MTYLPFIVINLIILGLVAYVVTRTLADHREHREQLENRHRNDPNRY